MRTRVRQTLSVAVALLVAMSGCASPFVYSTTEMTCVVGLVQDTVTFEEASEKRQQCTAWTGNPTTETRSSRIGTDTFDLSPTYRPTP